MRENRPYGLEGGEGGSLSLPLSPDFYPPPPKIRHKKDALCFACLVNVDRTRNLLRLLNKSDSLTEIVTKKHSVSKLDTPHLPHATSQALIAGNTHP